LPHGADVFPHWVKLQQIFPTIILKICIAGASLTMLAELDRTELIDTSLPTVHSQSLKDVSDPLRNISDAVKAFFTAGSAAIPIQTAFSHSERCYALDADREKTVFAD
jgi:dihydroxy-acid dehydratase